MKRFMALILAILFVFASAAALAESCPLPDVNTDAEINFSGFEWYTDYETTMKVARKKSFGDYMDYFEEDSCTTPHWATAYNSINSFAGSEDGCGGYAVFYYDLPDVAGYRLSNIYLYFMWDPEVGPVSDYKAKGAVQFYMAKYEFGVTDLEGCYKDLVTKLKKLYGDDPVEDEYGYFGTYYTCWVNGDGALVCVCYDDYDVTLVYCAPGHEEKLLAVEKTVRQKEIDDAAGDMSGL